MIMAFLRWLSLLFCKHPNATFVQNFSGDMINARNGARSEWKCNECGRLFTKGVLHPEEWHHKG